MSALNNRLDNLTPEQREALLKRLLASKQEKLSTHHIPPRARDVTPSLSHAQERLWFLEQLTPGNAFYNIPSVIPLGFDVNVTTLKQVINTIVKRHESLRTVFGTEEGRPVQLIRTNVQIPLLCTDLRDQPETQKKAEAARLANEATHTPFDITTGPLIRTSLLQLEPQYFLLVVTMHHIVSDGWSMGVFFRELSTLYNAIAFGAPSDLPELAIQYADFAEWQRQWLDGNVLEKQLNYWVKQLDGTPQLQLPTDKERPSFQSFRGAHHPIALSSRLTGKLIALSERHDVTLYMTTLSAFYTLLYRYSGQKDIAVGSYIANRNHDDVENLIGFFVNTLVMRTDFHQAKNFAELLNLVKTTAAGAFDHQDLPFPKLVDEIQPDRDLSRNPIFQVVFHLLNTPGVAAEAVNPEQWLPETEWHTAIFDLIVTLHRQGDQLIGGIEYNTDLFLPATIKRMEKHFINLLDSIVENPLQPLSDFSMLTDEERTDVLVNFNQTTHTLEATNGIVPAFFEIAARMPDATAFIDCNSSKSYALLASRVNLLYQQLQRRNVGTETLVAVCLERSVDAVAAILAIFACGAAYLPLDPGYPRRRLTFMLKDSKSALLLTRRQLWRQSDDIEVLWLDDIDTVHNDLSPLPCFAPQPCPIDRLAYVIYTSGSTGAPKGVCVEHGQISNRLQWMWHHYPFSDDEVLCHKTALSFVDSLWEIFGALLQGRPTLIVANDVVRDPRALVDVLAQHQVSRLWLVPSLLRGLLDNCPDMQYRLPKLRFWVSSGENLSAQLLQTFQRQMPDATLYNLYGTSEIWDATWYTPPADAQSLTRVPIGRAIWNTRTFVLDANEQPVPVGVPGELYVEGTGLARAYLHRPKLTDEKFVYSSIPGLAGARLYRTGDLVRWLVDGNLEFIGRIDQQVKVRGMRIELSEVERALAAHDGIDAAAVVVRDEGTPTARLAAFVVQNSEYTGDDNADKNWSTEKVDQWRSVWDDTYQRGERANQEQFNASGFISSYDQQAIPDEEVAEWVDQAVHKILAAKPERVLEIGCGTGLLLWQIAPHVKQYVATDFSPHAIHSLTAQLQRYGADYRHVRVNEQPADDFSGLDDGLFDTIVLHSVAQYFPGVDYLLEVIEGAIKRLSPGGHLYIGDVRDLNLLPAFYASVWMHNAKTDTSLQELQKHIQKCLAEEQELALDPLLFPTFLAQLTDAYQVIIEPKRGSLHNEFSRFRYDVTIHATPAQIKPEPVHWIDWHHGATPEQILAKMGEKDMPIGVRGVPDKRSARFLEATRLIDAQLEDEIDSAAQLDDRVAMVDGTDPESWFTSSHTHKTCQLRWSGAGSLGTYDVIYGLKGRFEQRDTATPPQKPWHRYANNPLQGLFTQKLVPHVRAFLTQTLPEESIPSSFTLLEKLPLTPSGKLDRNSLPSPTSTRSGLDKAFVKPVTPLQQTLAQLYSDLLGISKVGINDDFFTDLGGHSLLAAQLSARVLSQLNIELPLRDFFESSTVAALEEVINAQQEFASERPKAPALVRRSRKEFSVTTSDEG